MRNLRGIRVAASVVWFVTVAAGCVKSADESCGGSMVCSAGTTCVALTREGESGFACASDDQLAACSGMDDGAGCMVDGVDGSCLGGACLPSVCGDGINDPVYEMCDDGNVRSGDGCSGDCRSLETCGNGIPDLAVGEQCDEGALNVTGDGCSFHCQREYRLWRDVTPSPPAIRSVFGLATDPVRGIFMFGGATTSLGPTVGLTASFADSWRWDDATWLEQRSTSPVQSRAGMAMANDNHGHVLLFGGSDESGMTSDDTWLWDGVAWRKLAPAARPPARNFAGLVCATGTATLCVLFGGQNGTAYLDDTWTWNGTTWTPVTLVVKPTGRRLPGLGYDATAKRVVLFSGEDVNGIEPSDTWTFENNVWTLRSANSGPTGPHPTRPPSVAWSDADQRLYMLTENNIAIPRTYRWDGTTFSWVDVAGVPGGNDPKLVYSASPARLIAVSTLSASEELATFTLSGGNTWNNTKETRPTKGNKRTPAAYDEKRGVTVVLEASTFEWTGAGWRSNPSGAMAPPTSDGSALVYQAQCSTVIGFGGGDVNAAMGTRNNVTASYSGNLWSSITATPPPARTRHAMTYDRARKAIVMFGGLAPGASNDTWELTTTDCQTWTWTEIQPTTKPPARSSATLVYDEKRDVSVLFGGDSQAGTPLSDTWEWDGTTWKQRMTPAPGTPDPRFEHMSAYDPRRQKVLLFGGRGSGMKMSDVWEFDGVLGAWVRIAPAIIPAGRNGSGFALDVTGNLVAFNGDLGTSSSVSVIRLSSELSSEPPETCVRATDDLDGDGLAGCMDPDCWGRCAPLCPPGRTCAADAPRCGNTTCDPLEDYVLCPGDCSAP